MTMFSLDIIMKYILQSALLLLPDQIQCDWTRFLRCFSPFNWFWRWFIFLPCLLFLYLFFLLLFAIFIFRFRHEFSKEQSRHLMRMWINLFHLWFPRNLRQKQIQFSQNRLIINNEVFLFKCFLLQEFHQHFLLFIQFLLTLKFIIPVILIRVYSFFI